MEYKRAAIVVVYAGQPRKVVVLPTEEAGDPSVIQGVILDTLKANDIKLDDIKLVQYEVNTLFVYAYIKQADGWTWAWPQKPQKLSKHLQRMDEQQPGL